jgi:hypothetical protein
MEKLKKTKLKPTQGATKKKKPRWKKEKWILPRAV